MNWMFLTQVGGILKPFAWIMGMILNAIYKLVAAMGIQNIALCIVVFTIVVKMITLPLTIKQQKFAKVSALMTPEIKALQEKYKNIDRSDREAMQRYTMEQQAIYQKYGSSPLGGCLPLLIMLPIIFALYRVIYAIPAYVTDVNTLYKNVATDVTAISKDIDSDFSEYAGNRFGREEQIRLCRYLERTPAKVMAVIKDTPFVYELYRPKFKISSFDKKYLVSFKNRNERSAQHLLITNY